MSRLQLNYAYPFVQLPCTLWGIWYWFTYQAADEAFETEREKAKEVDALAQIFRVSDDLVKSRLLISQVWWVV